MLKISYFLVTGKYVLEKPLSDYCATMTINIVTKLNINLCCTVFWKQLQNGDITKLLKLTILHKATKKEVF